MTRKIFLDLETLPPDAETYAFSEAPMKLSPAASDDTTPAPDEQFRALALKAESGRLLTIGLIIEEEGRVVHHGLLGRDRNTGRFHLNEAQTLQAFWRLVSRFNPQRDQFIGHNIADFDLPFLFKRSVINRVPPSLNLSFRRYQRQPIFDTMWEWSHWRHRISLDNLATALQIASPKQFGLDGSQIYDCFLEGRHTDIALYCMRDVECAREVYYRLNFIDAPPLAVYEQKALFMPEVAFGSQVAGMLPV